MRLNLPGKPRRLLVRCTLAIKMSALLQLAIKESVYQQTGYRVDKQSKTDIIVIMRAVYFNNYLDPYTKKTCEAVRELNTILINVCTNQVADGIMAYINYTKDASQLAVPLEHSKYETIKGEYPLYQSTNI